MTKVLSMKQKHTPKRTSRNKTILVKKCHECGKLIESLVEARKCPQCGKNFLPSNYFNKIHNQSNKHEFDELFLNSDDVCEEHLVKGLNCLW